jgi:fucose 4-O-acetylase-like acetyltransferase
MPLPTTPAGTRELPRPRDPLLDNARAILIVLVVVGHVLALHAATTSDAVYLWVYSFHMPAFVLVSGYLSRSYEGTPRQLGTLVTTLLAPYVVFQLIGTAISSVRDGTPWTGSLLHPSWTLWFLLALFAWRLATPLLKQLRWPVLIAVLVSLATPFDPRLGQQGSLARVLGMLPFFVIGLVMRPEHLELLRRRALRPVAVLALLAAMSVAVVLAPHAGPEPFYMDGSYVQDTANVLRGAALRLGALAAGLVGTFALLCLCPRRETWWSRLGRNSLTVYLLHAAILAPLRGNVRLSDLVPGLPGTLVLGVAAVALAVVLGTDTVSRLTAFVVRPPLARRILRKDARDALVRPSAQHSGDHRDAPRGDHSPSHSGPSTAPAPP